MKKYVILFWIISLAASLLSTQLYVVGEVFTATWCGFCPAARSALRQMYNQSDEFEYLIPLIWQQDGPYPSPNYGQRTSLYSVGGIPHGQWGGHLSYVGGGPATYSNYVQRYNQLVNTPSPIEVELDFEITGQNQLNITADVEMLQSITTTNNKILFIVSYNLDDEQPGDYFASVIRYNEQDFTLSSSGQTAEFSHSFNIDTWWDLAKAHAIVIIQTFAGNRTIHQAAGARLSDLIAPSGLVGYPGNSQALLAWNAPDTPLEILGYNIYRNGEVVNDQPYGETTYTDMNLQNGTSYSYHITALYDEAESGPSNIVVVTPFEAPPGLVQIGSGDAINGTTQAAPVNIYYRSQRGQMVYTADEINMAGFTGPGELTEFGFYVHASPIHNLPNFHIRIKHTTATNAATHDNGPYDITQVIPSYNPTPGGWDMLELSEPFEWNGVDNILIDTAFDLVPSWNASGQLRVFNSPSGYRYAWNDNVSQINVTTNNVVDYKPQIRLQFTGTEPPEFPAPENLSAVAGDGVVDLMWEAPGTRSLLGYNVYRDAELINTEIVTETEYSDTDVENGITYTYYVTALYTDGESLPSNSVEATPEGIYPFPPQNLTATVIDDVNVYLEWEAPESSDFLTAYNIYRDQELIGQNGADTLDYLDEELSPGVYFYYVTALYDDLESESSNTVEITIEDLSADDTNPSLPVTALKGNFPNPFNPETTIEFSLEKSGPVSIEVYNIMGQRIITLVNDHYLSGNHRIVWKGNDDSGVSVGSGIYFYRMVSGSYTSTRKMILLK